MSYAGHLMEDYFRRTGRPGAHALDAAYQYQAHVLRDMLDRLEVILDDEGVPQETAQRVIRCMLYGSPSVADAELRMQQDKRMKDLLARVPPQVKFPPGIFAGPEQEARSRALRDGEWENFAGLPPGTDLVSQYDDPRL